MKRTLQARKMAPKTSIRFNKKEFFGKQLNPNIPCLCVSNKCDTNDALAAKIIAKHVNKSFFDAYIGAKAAMFVDATMIFNQLIIFFF